MLPRWWPIQAAVSAVCATVGYALGTLVQAGVRRVLAPLGREPGPTVRTRSWQGLGAVAVLAALSGIVVWPVTQADQAELLGTDAPGALAVVPLVVLTLVLAALLFAIGRIVGHGVGVLDRSLTRTVPTWVAHGLAAIIVVAIGWQLSRDVVIDRFFDWANDRFGALDETTAEGIEQPTSDAVTGGPGSLVPWDTLGFEGRSFVATATTAEELQGFWGEDAEVGEPVRAYAGLDSADDVQARADLAVAELERTGGFDRAVLCIVSTTGTGWVDPDAAVALELLHRGDTALVGMQYSFLPSWISFLADRDEAAAAAGALYDAVHQRWADLPPDDRPTLVVFAESLGSFGLETALAGPDAAASVEVLRDGADGVLITGPTESNPVWRQLQGARDPDSPPWSPVYGGGATVQTTVRGADLPADDPAWTDPRLVWVHHANDPVGVWTWDTLWRRPPWMGTPRGPDLPRGVLFVPFVTWVQQTADLAAGFSAPAGQGHSYVPDFVPAWAAIVPPPGWSEEDTRRLEAYVAGLPSS